MRYVTVAVPPAYAVNNSDRNNPILRFIIVVFLMLARRHQPWRAVLARSGAQWFCPSAHSVPGRFPAFF